MNRPLALLFIPLALALAEKARSWQTGTVIELASERKSEITGVSSGPVDGEASVDRRQWDVNQFVVDAGDRLIWISETIRRMGGSTLTFRVGKGAGLAPGQMITFALDRDTCYLQAPDGKAGKERKLHVDRITLKPKP